MRKVRDYDAELKVLGEKAKALKERRVRQLGELVMATGADALDTETLAGVLLTAVSNSDQGMKEGWRGVGATFFRRTTKRVSRRAERDEDGLSANSHGDATH